MSKITLLLFVSGLLAAGCTSKNAPKIAAVDGVVTFKGQPVPHAKVVFLPQKIANGQTCIGQTDAEGRFSKIVMAKTGGAGAVLGTYSVTVTEGWPPNTPIPVDDLGQEKSPPRGKWPQKYRDSAGSTLQAEVVAGKANHFEFDITK